MLCEVIDGQRMQDERETGDARRVNADCRLRLMRRGHAASPLALGGPFLADGAPPPIRNAP